MDVDKTFQLHEHINGQTEGQCTSLIAHQPEYKAGRNGNHNAYEECKNNGRT